MLSPNGSSDTCISDGVFHIPMPCLHGALPVYPMAIAFLHAACTAHGYARFVRLTMSSLSQARPLEDLPSSHRAFQEHAAHIARWPAMLSSKGSGGTG